MTPLFGHAAPSDADTILELMQEFYREEHLRFDPEKTPRAVGQILENSTHGLIELMMIGEDVAGYLVVTFGFSLEFGGRDALLDELYVRESFRGRGIGRAALQHVEEICRREGIVATHLHVDRGNAAAARLYGAAGYQAHDRDIMTKWL
jgi:GNAT superfamily N-acetyltransferase